LWGKRLSYFPSADTKSAQLQPMSLGATVPPFRAPAGLAADDLPRGKVLVIEDEAVLALDLQRMLREAGFRVAGPAATLGDAQRLISRSPIDCALLDIDVNQRTPLPVADLLAFADIPFVFITNGGREAIPREHLHRPVLEKPVRHSDLIAAVERVLGRAAHDNGRAGSPSVGTWPRIFPSL